MRMKKFKFHRGPTIFETPPIIRYLDDKPDKYKIDFGNNKQINCRTCFERGIRRTAEISLSFEKRGKWFYFNEMNVWAQYETLIQDQIENAYCTYLSKGQPRKTIIQFPGRPEQYELDFFNGTQTNCTYQTNRRIRRD